MWIWSLHASTIRHYYIISAKNFPGKLFLDIRQLQSIAFSPVFSLEKECEKDGEQAEA
jgi:hypothetical protein